VKKYGSLKGTPSGVPFVAHFDPITDSPFFLIDSLEQIPVPEPSSMMLLSVG
jgi:hypothetical protein